MKKCIDCKKIIGQKAVRCLSCAAKERMKYRDISGVSNPMFGKKDEQSPNFIHGLSHNNKCLDCHRHINYGCVRCKSCAMKYNWELGKYSKREITGISNPNHKHGYFCTDNYCKCGNKISPATVAYGKKRCIVCSHKENLNGSYIDGRAKKWKVVRKQTFERDNYTCILCNTKGTYLQAHHIIHRKNCINIYEVNNLITLCINCHMRMSRIEFSEKYLYYKEIFLNYIKT